MKTKITLVLAFLLGLLSTAPAVAQTATTTTSLSVAATATGRSVTVASATNVAAGGSLYVDRELMTVISVSGTVVQVARSTGTAATSHSVGAIVYVATAAQGPFVFRSADPAGSCTSTNEQYLPQVNPASGAVWDCPSALGLWVNYKDAIIVSCQMSLYTDMIDRSCFTADKPYAVGKILYVSTVAESGGTLTVIPKKQTGTQAAASGDSLATAISGVSTVAQTVTTFTLTSTPAFLRLATGDRLGLDFTDDVAGELSGLLITFVLYAR